MTGNEINIPLTAKLRQQFAGKQLLVSLMWSLDASFYVDPDIGLLLQFEIEND